MTDFIEVPANKSSISKRRLVYGVGLNDASYLTSATDNSTGKMIRCPFYLRWYDMLKRCYSEVLHKKRPTYVGCIVVEEWLAFSNFKVWMESQDWRGMALDKDILLPRNKVYGPDLCVFIPNSLNTLLNNNESSRGDCPLGVYFHKNKGKFIARCNVNGKEKHLGDFNSAEAANAAYRRFKSALIAEAAEQYPELKEALLVHADMYLKGEIK